MASQRVSGRSSVARGRSWARRERVVVEGHEVHAAVASGRTPVVAVHGLGCSHRYWGRLARALGPEVELVAPDLPGCGWSPAPARDLDVDALARLLGAWLRATDRAGAVLVANSAGCQVVAALASQDPDVVGAVVMVGPTLVPEGEGLVRQLVRLVADVPRERPDLWVVQLRDYLRCGPRRMLATARYLLDDPFEAHLGSLAGPVVVVRGEHDPVAPRGQARRVARAAGGPEPVEVPAAGHAAHHRRPEAVAMIVDGVRSARR